MTFSSRANKKLTKNKVELYKFLKVQIGVENENENQSKNMHKQEKKHIQKEQKTKSKQNSKLAIDSLRLLTWREIWELNWLWKRSEELSRKDAESEKILLSKIWPNFFSWAKENNAQLLQEKNGQVVGCQRKDFQRKVQLFENVANTMLYTLLAPLEWAHVVSSLTTTESFRQAANERNYFYHLLNSSFQSEAPNRDEKTALQMIHERCLVFCQILENWKDQNFPKSRDWVFVIDQVISTPQTFSSPTFFLNCKLLCSILVLNHVFWLSEHFSGFHPYFSRFNNPLSSSLDESKVCSIMLRPSCCFENRSTNKTQTKAFGKKAQKKENEEEKEREKEKEKEKGLETNQMPKPNAQVASKIFNATQVRVHPKSSSPLLRRLYRSNSPIRASSRSPLFRKRSISLPYRFDRKPGNLILQSQSQPQFQAMGMETKLVDPQQNRQNRALFHLSPLQQDKKKEVTKEIATKEVSFSKTRNEVRKVWALCFGANTDTLPFIRCLDCDVCNQPFQKSNAPVLELVYLQASPVVRLGSLSAARLSGNVPLTILEDANLKEFKGLSGDQYLLILNNPDEAIKKTSFKTNLSQTPPTPLFPLSDKRKLLGAPKHVFLEKEKKREKLKD